MKVVEPRGVDGVVLDVRPLDISHDHAIVHGVDNIVAGNGDAGVGTCRGRGTDTDAFILVAIAVTSPSQHNVTLNVRDIDGVAVRGEGTDIDPSFLDGIREQVVRH